MITVSDKTAWDKIMAENAGKAVSDLAFWPLPREALPATAGLHFNMQLLQNTRVPGSVGPASSLEESCSVWMMLCCCAAWNVLADYCGLHSHLVSSRRQKPCFLCHCCSAASKHHGQLFPSTHLSMHGTSPCMLCAGAARAR